LISIDITLRPTFIAVSIDRREALIYTGTAVATGCHRNLTLFRVSARVNVIDSIVHLDE